MSIITEAMEVNTDARMTIDELTWLFNRFGEVSKGGNSLEIGAYRGMLTYICAYFMKAKGREGSKHFVVDTFDIPIDEDEDNTHHYGEHTMEMMLSNLKEYAPFVKLVRSKSLDWAGSHEIIENEFDYCFIDGDHRDPIVYLELCLCGNSVKHIFGHDYGWGNVTKSVDRFCKEKGYKVYQPISGRGVFELIKE